MGAARKATNDRNSTYDYEMQGTKAKTKQVWFCQNKSRLVGFPSYDPLGHFSPKDGQENVKVLLALFIISQMK